MFWHWRGLFNRDRVVAGVAKVVLVSDVGYSFQYFVQWNRAIVNGIVTIDVIEVRLVTTILTPSYRVKVASWLRMRCIGLQPPTR